MGAREARSGRPLQELFREALQAGHGLDRLAVMAVAQHTRNCIGWPCGCSATTPGSNTGTGSAAARPKDRGRYTRLNAEARGVHAKKMAMQVHVEPEGGTTDGAGRSKSRACSHVWHGVCRTSSKPSSSAPSSKDKVAQDKSWPRQQCGRELPGPKSRDAGKQVASTRCVFVWPTGRLRSLFICAAGTKARVSARPTCAAATPPPTMAGYPAAKQSREWAAAVHPSLTNEKPGMTRRV